MGYRRTGSVQLADQGQRGCGQSNNRHPTSAFKKAGFFKNPSRWVLLGLFGFCGAFLCEWRLLKVEQIWLTKHAGFWLSDGNRPVL